MLHVKFGFKRGEDANPSIYHTSTIKLKDKNMHVLYIASPFSTSSFAPCVMYDDVHQLPCWTYNMEELIGCFALLLRYTSGFLKYVIIMYPKASYGYF